MSEADGVIAETDRIVIRPWRLDEAPRVLEILSRIEVVKWLGDGLPVPMRDLDEARERIARYQLRSVVPPLGIWAVVPRATGAPAGTVLLVELPNGAGEVEIGWHLHPDSHGHGYATEAAELVLARGFDGGLREVYALTHLDNHPSQAVCNRLGLNDIGVLEKCTTGRRRSTG
ncbi:MAG: GNAT family N-acetyltransferase [Marmoricola sp.]